MLILATVCVTLLLLLCFVVIHPVEVFAADDSDGHVVIEEDDEALLDTGYATQPRHDACDTCLRRSIFVTGLPRSGTTVMGYMASLLDHQWMVHEPANPSNRNVALGGRVTPSKHGFPFGEEQFPDVASWPDDGRAAERYFDAFIAAFCQTSVDQVVCKDPTFLSSAEWFVEDYGVGRALVMIRHPAAVVASWKALGWEDGNIVRLTQLYATLMTKYLLPLWWRYGGDEDAMILPSERLGTSHPARTHGPQGEDGCGRRWLFLRLEDFCRDPVGVTVRLQETMARPESLDPYWLQELSARVQAFIHAPTEATGRHQYHAVRMDTAAQIDVWKEELTRFEVDIVKTGTQPIWSMFYGADEW